MTMSSLRLGIASYSEIKQYTLAIARGEYKPSPEDPKIWFSSFESLLEAFSGKNKPLLEIIKRENLLQRE